MYGAAPAHGTAQRPHMLAGSQFRRARTAVVHAAAQMHLGPIDAVNAIDPRRELMSASDALRHKRAVDVLRRPIFTHAMRLPARHDVPLCSMTPEAARFLPTQRNWSLQAEAESRGAARSFAPAQYRRTEHCEPPSCTRVLYHRPRRNALPQRRARRRRCDGLSGALGRPSTSGAAANRPE